MRILYSVVARGNDILARFASCAGNFSEVTDQVLSKINTNVDDKLTYLHGNYLFHYICDQGIIFMCITDDEFERSRAFAFLHEIEKRFLLTYGEMAKSAIPFAMNSDFSRVLAKQMKHYSEDKDPDTLSKVKQEIDELKDIMVKNIDSIAARGEKLELLVNKTEDLENNSVTFRTNSRALARSLWWKNVKLIFFVASVVAILIYLVGSMICGGLTWKTCVS